MLHWCLGAPPETERVWGGLCKPVVGKHVGFPEKQYKFAVWEVIDRYLIPRVSSIFKSLGNHELDPDAAVNAGIQKGGKEFNPGFEQLRELAERGGMKFAVYLHPEKSEIESGVYNLQGKEIIAWARENNVPLYLGLEEGESLEGLRDNIHLKELEQKRLAECFKKIYQEFEN